MTTHVSTFKLAFSGGVSSSLTGAFSKMTASTRKLGQQLESVNATAEKLQAFRKMTQRLNELRTEMDKGGRTGAKAQKKWEQTAAGLREMSAELRRAGVNMDDLAGSERRLNRQTEALNRSLARRQRLAQFRQRFSGMPTTPGMLAGGIGLYGMAHGLKTVLGESMTFRDNMADVRKTVDELANPSQLDFFGDRIRRLARDMGTHEGLTSVAAQGGQLGIIKRDLFDFMKLTTVMSTAFDTMEGKTADIVAGLMNQFGLPLQGVRKLGDVITYTAANTAAAEKDIVNALGRMAGVARQFGLTENQASALASTMIALKKPPEVAARGINYMLQALQTAPDRGKKFQIALKRLGYTAEGLKISIQKDAQGALMKFLETLNKLPKTERASYLTRFFGTEWSDDLAILVDRLDEYKKHLKLVGDEAKYSGAMQREFSAKQESPIRQWQRVKNQFKNVLIAIGDEILPSINFKAIQDVLIGVEERVKHIFAEIRRAAGPGVAALKEAFGLNEIKDWQETGRKLADTVGFMASTFGSAFTAISLGISTIKQGLDWIGTTMGKLAGAVSMGDWQGVKKVLIDAFSPLTITLKGALLSLADLVKEWAVNTLNGFLKPVRDGIDGIVGIVRNMVEAWKEVGRVIDGLITKFQRLFSLKPGSDKGATKHIRNLGGPMMARGGPVFAGRPYIVGERGPELFMPRFSGTIIPNHKLNSMLPAPSMDTAGPVGGRGNVTVSFNINISGGGDKASVEEALIESEQRLRRLLDEVYNNDLRVSYAS